MWDRLFEPKTETFLSELKLLMLRVASRRRQTARVAFDILLFIDDG